VKPTIFPIMLATAIAVGAACATAQQASDPGEARSANASQTTAPNSTPDDADAAATAALITKANAAAAKAADTTAANKGADNAALAKKAKQFGWRPEIQHGNSVFCRDDPVLGSRFSTRRCVGPVQLTNVLAQAEFDRDQLKQRSCAGSCGGN
jgi:hypothetical protein